MATFIKRLAVTLVLVGVPFAFAGTGNGGPSVPKTGTITILVGVN